MQNCESEDYQERKHTNFEINFDQMVPAINTTKQNIFANKDKDFLPKLINAAINYKPKKFETDQFLIFKNEQRNNFAYNGVVSEEINSNVDASSISNQQTQNFNQIAQPLQQTSFQ